jgi:hypothetical protein
VRLTADMSRKKTLQAELQGLEAIGQVAAMNVDRLTGRINKRVREIVNVLGRQTPQARQILRKLLTEKIDLEPVGSGRARGYTCRAPWRSIDSLPVRRSELTWLWWPQRIRTRVCVVSASSISCRRAPCAGPHRGTSTTGAGW